MNQGFTLAINSFADLTTKEFQASRTGYKRQKSNELSALKSKSTSFKYENLTVVPSTMDWRTKGVVTPIKDQGDCGKDYYFQGTLVISSSPWPPVISTKLFVGPIRDHGLKPLAIVFVKIDSYPIAKL
ncbi:Senescence-specific cysteine protease sag12 [Ancistrocladus abbreviatus]